MENTLYFQEYNDADAIRFPQSFLAHGRLLQIPLLPRNAAAPLIQPTRVIGPMRLRTRPAQPEDAESLAAIGAATFALACPPSTPASELEAYIRAELSPEKFLAHLASPQNSLVAAEVDERVVGYLMLCREEFPPEVSARRPLELRRLYVLRQFHGAGIAQTLLGVALEEARAGGHDALWLGVSKHNARGIAFYRKLGFRVVGEQTFPVGSDLHDDFIMSRAVA